MSMIITKVMTKTGMQYARVEFSLDPGAAMSEYCLKHYLNLSQSSAAYFSVRGPTKKRRYMLELGDGSFIVCPETYVIDGTGYTIEVEI